ncbi:MAG: YgiT-type zinc finger protein [Methanosarcinales archaeon]
MGEEVEIEVDLKSETDLLCCTRCGYSKMDPIKTQFKYGDIVFLNVKAYKCPKCGEEVLDHATALRLERDISLRDLKDRTKYDIKVTHIGEDYLIPLPKEISVSEKTTATLFSLGNNEYLLKIPSSYQKKQMV